MIQEGRRINKKFKKKERKKYPYKHRTVCRSCGRPYGYDRDCKDSGICPICNFSSSRKKLRSYFLKSDTTTRE